MIKSKNELIYIIRQVIGEEESDGFYTSIHYNGETIKVPNFLFKDAPSQYPEIRISPFLKDEQVSNSIRLRRYNYDNKREVYNAKFQVDIYATNVAQVNQIYDAVKQRIDLFYDIDTVIYGYDGNFIAVKPNVYLNKKITSKNFKFSDITIGCTRIKPVQNKEDLNKINNTYLLNHEGLYVHTPLLLRAIRMRSIINGLLLPDGNTTYSRGVIKMQINKKRMLSELDANNVERISFDLNIFYSMDNIRNAGPIATHVEISDYYG